MIQRDYIVRMIEEIRRVVEVIMAYRSEGRWQEVVGTVEFPPRSPSIYLERN